MIILRYCSNDGDYEFLIPLSYFEKISKKTVSCYPKETGGVFVGFYDKDYHSAKVTKLLFNKNDKGSVTRFFREGNNPTKLLAKIWRKSKGKEYYIGEWHSHPKSYPFPSNIDTDRMVDMAKTQEEQCRTPILCILGKEMRDYQKDVYLFAYPNGEDMVKLDFKNVVND